MKYKNAITALALAALLLAGILFGVQYITGFRLFEKDKLQGEE